MRRMKEKQRKSRITGLCSAITACLVAMSLLVPVFALNKADDTKWEVESFTEANPINEQSVPQGTAKENIELPDTIKAKAKMVTEQTEEAESASEESAVQTSIPVTMEGEEPEAQPATEPVATEPTAETAEPTEPEAKEIEIPVTWKETDPYDANTPGKYVFTAEYDKEKYQYEGEAPYAIITVTASQVTEPAVNEENTNKETENKDSPGTDNSVSTSNNNTAKETTDNQQKAKAVTEPELNKDDAYLSKFEISKITDGTPGFDTDDDPNSDYYKNKTGNDYNGSNGIVRSFDNITYDIDYQTETHGGIYEKGKIEFEFVLPLTSEEATWDTTTMSWMDSGFTVKTENRTYDFNGDGAAETVSCQILSGSKTLVRTTTNPTAIPGSGTLQAVVNVLAMPNNSKVQPVLTAWMEYNKAGDKLLSDSGVTPTGNRAVCSEHKQIEQKTIKAKEIKVTAEPRYNVHIRSVSAGYGVIVDTYNFSEGNSLALDKDKGNQTGGTALYGVTLQLYNHENRKFKGVEFPTGPITFDLELSTTFKPDTGSLTASQNEYIAKNYAPMILSYGPQKESYIQQDGRDIKENQLAALSAAPLNSGMTASYLKNGSERCYEGGTWNATKTNQTVSVTVKDYEIKYPYFPNTNQSSLRTLNTYFDYRTGLENIGCFSGGKFYILVPFYNTGTTNISNKGKHILKDLNVNRGNFYVTVEGCNLKASSVSGQKLKEVKDNSNQTNQVDDVVTNTVYLELPGNYDWYIGWSKFENISSTAYIYDVLGRGLTDIDSWCNNGQDVLTKGSPVAITSGVRVGENGDANNRLYAADVLAKFDSRAVTLTEETAFNSRMFSSGYEVTILYATKPDGTNWSSDTEMNNTKIEDLKYYKSLKDIPSNEKCIAFLSEYRFKDNDPSNFSKYLEGTRLLLQVKGKVNSDASLTGNVYQTVLGGLIWRKQDYEAARGNIPTMLGNDPANPTKLPSSWVTDYRNYEKAYYDENGYAGGHTGDWDHGDSLRIVSLLPNIKKRVEQQEDGKDKSIYQMDSEQRYVDFALTPSFDALPEGVSETTTVTITDQMDAKLSYVPGSAYLGGTYTQNPRSGQQGTITGGTQTEPDIVVNTDGTKTLTWKLVNVSTADPLPIIHYSALIGTPGDEEHDVEHNDLLDNTAMIKSTGDLRAYSQGNGNLATTSIRVSKLVSTALSKIPDSRFYDPQDYVSYTMSIGNNGANNIGKAVIMDTMPISGDAKGSNFTGDIFVKSMKVDTKTVDNLSSWRCYYTTDPGVKDTISADYNYDDIVGGYSVINGQPVTWTKVDIEADGSIPSLAGTKPTGIVWVGTLKTSQTFKIYAGFQAPDAKKGEVLANGLSRGEDKTTVKTYYGYRTLSGLPWFDVNENGQREASEELIVGVRVQLLKKNASGSYEVMKDKDGNEIYVDTAKTAKTVDHVIASTNNKNEPVDMIVKAIAKADGSYEFDGLPAGDYGVRFISQNISIEKYVATKVNEGEDSTDSDGVPTYSDGTAETSLTNTLKKTEILDINMPKATEMQTAVYESKYHDSGFFYKTGNVLIKKIGDDGKVLAGVEMKLEKKKEDGTWETISESETTDSKGEIKYENLYPGEYQLSEIQTVGTNSMLKEPVKITLPYAKKTGDAYGESKPAYVEQGKDYYLELTFTIQNGQVFSAPASGGLGLTVLIVIGGGLIMIMTGFVALAGKARKACKG